MAKQWGPHLVALDAHLISCLLLQWFQSGPRWKRHCMMLHWPCAPLIWPIHWYPLMTFDDNLTWSGTVEPLFELQNKLPVGSKTNSHGRLQSIPLQPKPVSVLWIFAPSSCMYHCRITVSHPCNHSPWITAHHRTFLVKFPQQLILSSDKTRPYDSGFALPSRRALREMLSEILGDSPLKHGFAGRSAQPSPTMSHPWPNNIRGNPWTQQQNLFDL